MGQGLEQAFLRLWTQPGQTGLLQEITVWIVFLFVVSVGVEPTVSECSWCAPLPVHIRWLRQEQASSLG